MAQGCSLVAKKLWSMSTNMERALTGQRMGGNGEKAMIAAFEKKKYNKRIMSK